MNQPLLQQPLQPQQVTEAAPPTITTEESGFLAQTTSIQESQPLETMASPAQQSGI
jgi:hypothetical protein